MRMPPITVTLHSVRSVVKQNPAGATQDGLHTPSVREPVRTVGIPASVVWGALATRNMHRIGTVTEE